MRSTQKVFVLGAALLGFCSAAQAVTIVQAVPTSGIAYFGAGFAFAQSWTMDAAYTNVSIAPSLNSVTGTATAYLTTQIGAGTDASLHQLASTTFSSGSGFTTLFSGLNLGPGTHFLTLHSENDGLNWWDSGLASTAAVTTAPGASVGNAFGAGSNGFGGSSLNTVYPPASVFVIRTFNSADAVLGLSVTGDPVPEPSTSVLVAAGLLLASVARVLTQRS